MSPPLAPNADTLDCALAVIDLKLASATLQRDRAIKAAVHSLLLHNEGPLPVVATPAVATPHPHKPPTWHSPGPASAPVYTSTPCYSPTPSRAPHYPGRQGHAMHLTSIAVCSDQYLHTTAVALDVLQAEAQRSMVKQAKQRGVALTKTATLLRWSTPGTVIDIGDGDNVDLHEQGLNVALFEAEAS